MPFSFPTRAEVERLAVNPLVERTTGRFDLAIVLNGTVSSGAYTAGVLDFLVEALDCWYRAREDGLAQWKGKPIPAHDVNLVLAAGASGGGVCAAILARVLGGEFPHARLSTSPADLTLNPFYDTWVNRLSFENFATTTDLGAGMGLKSLLNAMAIDTAAKAIVDFQGRPLGTRTSPRVRPYLNDPFRAIFTLCNLRGMPYRIGFGEDATRGQHFVDHADWVSFRRYLHAAPIFEGNEFTLSDTPAGINGADWTTFAEFAKATAAFPGGFAARTLRRPITQYLYRAVPLPSESGPRRDWDVLLPATDLLLSALDADGCFRFVSVDGGTLNNAPVEIARTRLAGLLGRNPRDPTEAHAGVLLIDPFAEVPNFAAKDDPTKLAAVLGSTLGSLISHARYATSDLLLAAEDEVCSRFMISPMREGADGGPAIATSGLGAFLGFFDQRYRRHDYMLGRANCRDYLRTELSLDARNPLFREPAEQAHVFEAEGRTWRPIIPLVGSADDAQPVADWPAGGFDRRRVERLLRTRVAAVVGKAADEIDIGGRIGNHLLQLFNPAVTGILVDRALEEIDDAIADGRLS